MQRLILWQIIVAGGEKLQKDFKPSLDKQHRDALEACGMIDVEKEGRGFKLTATDAGWEWAGDTMGDRTTPPKAYANAEVLQIFMKRMKAVLEEKGVSLAEIFGDLGSGNNIIEWDDFCVTASKEVPIEQVSMDERIRAVYFHLTGGLTNQRVQLAALRPLVGGTREEQDATLRKMELSRQLTLYSNNNPREITAEDQAAAFHTPAGTEKHLVYLGGKQA